MVATVSKEPTNSQNRKQMSQSFVALMHMQQKMFMTVSTLWLVCLRAIVANMVIG